MSLGGSNGTIKQRWLGKIFANKRCFTITEYDPVYKVTYLGNVVTQYAKGDNSSIDKAVATLWRNYCANVRSEISMKLTVRNSGLKATTKEHGLTEYWANRITHCSASQQYPKVFCWVYRHEGRRLKQELRCHAVLCEREERAAAAADQLNERLSQALQEFRREKLSKQKARLSLASTRLDHPLSLPKRKQLLSTGSTNFRPPLGRSRSAPKLTAIDEIAEEDEEDEEVDDDRTLLFSTSIDDEEDFLDDEFCSVVSEVESSSDIVPDDVDSLSTGHETDSLDSDCISDELVRRRTSSLKLVDESIDEEDNVSDESGYSEEKLSQKKCHRTEYEHKAKR